MSCFIGAVTVVSISIFFDTVGCMVTLCFSLYSISGHLLAILFVEKIKTMTKKKHKKIMKLKK